MEEKKRYRSISRVSRSAHVLVLVLMLWLIIAPAAVSACPAPPSGDRSGCKDCVVDQMKYGCPSCVPLLHCMARCLWGGATKTKCASKCDCNGGKPRLSDCKKCMSRCKCSCVS